MTMTSYIFISIMVVKYGKLITAHAVFIKSIKSIKNRYLCIKLDVVIDIKTDKYIPEVL